METLLLTVRGESTAVLPRSLRMEMRPGTGSLVLPASPIMDATFRASVDFAWKSACLLAGRDDQDGVVSIAGDSPLHGWSAGASLGLLSLSLLLDRPKRDFFATGGATDDQGFWAGGVKAPMKWLAARGYAEQLQMQDCTFFSPPILGAPESTDVPFVMATDLGSAFSHLDPDGYAALHHRHRQLRQLEPENMASLDASGPFVIVSGPGAEGLPDQLDGISVVRRPQDAGDTWIELGANSMTYWRTQWAGEHLEKEILGLWDLARQCAVL